MLQPASNTKVNTGYCVKPPEPKIHTRQNLYRLHPNDGGADYLQLAPLPSPRNSDLAPKLSTGPNPDQSPSSKASRLAAAFGKVEELA